MKKKFTTERWEKALTAVFVRSISDPAYRRLCLSNAHEAVALVAPDLELPADFHFKFAARQQDVLYSYLLPPFLEDGTSTVEYAEVLIEQNATGLTHPPTNKTGTGDPNDPDDDDGSPDDDPKE